MRFYSQDFVNKYTQKRTDFRAEKWYFRMLI